MFMKTFRRAPQIRLTDGPRLAQHSDRKMRKWLTSLFLVATLACGVLSGAPLHTQEHSCPMMMQGEGGEMDCCAMA